jgi:hypothetical protein
MEKTSCIKIGEVMRRYEAIILYEAIKNEKYYPTEKENLFLESVRYGHGHLTEKQGKWLEDIYAKATGGGRYEKRG